MTRGPYNKPAATAPSLESLKVIMVALEHGNGQNVELVMKSTPEAIISLAADLGSDKRILKVFSVNGQGQSEILSIKFLDGRLQLVYGDSNVIYGGASGVPPISVQSVTAYRADRHGCRDI